MKIALAQVNPTVGDLEGNAARLRKAYDQAVGGGADLVGTPELATVADRYDKPSGDLLW